MITKDEQEALGRLREFITQQIDDGGDTSGDLNVQRSALDKLMAEFAPAQAKRRPHTARPPGRR